MYRKLCVPLILILLFLSACTITPVSPTPNQSADTTTSLPSPSELVDGYVSIIDTLYNEDHGLNGGIKYIAVDTSQIANLDRAAKDKLLKALVKYNCTVLEDTMDGLEAKGYIKDMNFTEGLLFILKDQPVSSGIITIVADKWRAGAGSIRYTFDLREKNGVWKIDRKYDFMIS